ncbi:GNAT family N-acetyltransferase [Parafilimonas sp.]|uniref:GNAT family N-acetyltransferase n=1 Tax=Parafilimonas sp. TaxID=1969739 RepID=UPI0039E62772
MATYEVRNEMYAITTDTSKLDVNVIHQYLSEESYWAQGMPRDVVEKSIDNSLCFGLYYNDAQVGFARLITDCATFAYLADVFILHEHRGKGLSKWLMEAIQAHPELQNLRRWLLTTKDAHGLYEQAGWTKVPDDYIYRFMMRHNPDVYKKPGNE